MAPKPKIADKYVKMDHHEHVLARPGMYIGSIEPDTYNTWVFNEKSGSMEKREITVVPGLYKIFDEIVVNAIDHVTRLKQAKTKDESVQLVKNIKITINKETGEISVWNDGEGIEVEMHPEYNIYIPELIFGHLLTSSNYNDDEEKTIGGQNGLGGKVSNIFSKSFTVETVDSKNKKFYSQTWSDNMTKKTKATVRAVSKKPYTHVTFTPDYERFHMKDGLSNDMYAMFIKRAYDVGALTDRDVNVYLNGQKLEFKTFEKYVDLFIGSKDTRGRVYEKINDRWEIVATSSDELGFDQISFVNGIWTIRGGKHVDYISNQIANGLADMLNKKKKGNEIKATHIKNHLMVFIKSTITNPTFDSQTKDLLTTPMSKFGSKAELSEAFFDKLYKTEIVEKAVTLADVGNLKALKKTDGKKSGKLRGMVKLDDANYAGTNKSAQCTLILTEGDSAKATALAGLSEIGRDFYGVFPLKGKLMNVKDVGIKKLLENEEIQAIKKILGLESGKVYKSLDELRYGRIMLMCDQDFDGSHIKGLLMNFFETLWPSLIDKGFIASLLTPIIKVTHNTTKQTLSFYNYCDYEAWTKATGTSTKYWTIKYYKGLGTSNEEEAKSYFKNMRLVNYHCNGKECNAALDLAFNKKRADDRKSWLGTYNPEICVNYDKEVTKVTYKDFIDRELIHFSVYDVKRSIPSVVDGLKPSQRKILFCCFKRNLIKETKVAQLAGYVSEHAAYHHGEASLQGAIINMAQNFVGSNNLNILLPNGQFGSRIMGGKDASAPRYIFTELNPLTMQVFKKDDERLLKYLDDDGLSIEPDYYVPIVPTVLVNGTIGIGTGFSTNVPSYNTIDVVNACKNMIKTGGKCKDELIPWTRGFKGTIVPTDETKSTFTCTGVYNFIGEKSVEITELPIGTWTEDYKAFLEEYLEKNPKVLKDYESHYTTQEVKFILHFNEPARNIFNEKDFKLQTKINTSNMHLFGADNIIKKYESVKEILEDFYVIRAKYYTTRKEEMIKAMREDMTEADAKRRFIEYVIAKKIPILGIKKAELEKMLEKFEFPKIDDGYNYLLNLPIQSLTAERAEALNKEVRSLEAKIKEYESLTVADMWNQELDHFAKLYTDDLAKYLEHMKSGKTAPKDGKKSKK